MFGWMITNKSVWRSVLRGQRLSPLELTEELFFSVARDSLYPKSPESNHKWYEVVIMLCGIAANADNVIAKVLAANDHALVGRCISSAANISEVTRRDVIQQLLVALRRKKSEDRDRTSDRRAGAAVGLGEINDVVAVPGLLDALDDEDAADAQ